jgi:hypothetical protein
MFMPMRISDPLGYHFGARQKAALSSWGPSVHATSEAVPAPHSHCKSHLKPQLFAPHHTTPSLVSGIRKSPVDTPLASVKKQYYMFYTWRDGNAMKLSTRSMHSPHGLQRHPTGEPQDPSQLTIETSGAQKRDNTLRSPTYQNQEVGLQFLARVCPPKSALVHKHFQLSTKSDCSHLRSFEATGVGPPCLSLPHLRPRVLQRICNISTVPDPFQ